jgi:CCR4-NOT transcription complex subunit 7/8
MYAGRDDMYAQDSIELLAKSGINFKKHEELGIDVEYFGELLMTSGLVLTDEVKWISFHRFAFAILCSYSLWI